MGFWAPEVLEEIRRRCDLVDIVSEHVHLRHQGKNLMGPCPFHEDRSPSFSVSPEKQLYHCFGCGTSGDLFAFVMKKEGLDFAGAVEWLARRGGVALPEGADSPADRRRGQEREQTFQALVAAAAFFQRLLRGHPSADRARQYLAGRGVTDASRDRFGIGYAPGTGTALQAALTRQGFPVETLTRAGLVAGSGGRPRDRFLDRLMFPIRDELGRVVGFGGRVLGAGEPKYLNSPETILFNKRRLWFGLDLARQAIRQSGRAVVMEGYLDVITACQHGFEEAVATLGTALGPEQAALLGRFAREAVVAYDADAPGQRAALKSGPVLRVAGLDVRVARISGGKDPDEFLRTAGAPAFQKALEEALPLVEFAFEQAAAGRDLNTVAGKVAVVEAVAPYLAAEANAVAQAAFMGRLAGRLGVPEDALRREVRKQAELAGTGQKYNKWNNRDNRRGSEQAAGPSEVAAALERAAGEGPQRAERRLLSLLLHHPALLSRARQQVEAGDFSVPGHRNLAERLLAIDLPAEDGAPAAATRLLDAMGPGDEAQLAAALLMEESVFEDPARAFDDCLRWLERRRLERGKAEDEAEIHRWQAAGEPIPPELAARWHERQRRLKGSSR